MNKEELLHSSCVFFFKLVTSNYYVLLKFFSQLECIEKHQYKFICPDFTLLIWFLKICGSVFSTQARFSIEDFLFFTYLHFLDVFGLHVQMLFL